MAHDLEQFEMSIDAVLDQNGKIYKKEELIKFKTAIDAFFSATGIERPQQEMQLSAEKESELEDMLSKFYSANTAPPKIG